MSVPEENNRRLTTFTIRQLLIVTTMAAVCLLPILSWGAAGVVVSVGILITMVLLILRHYFVAYSFFGVLAILLVIPLALLRPHAGAYRAQCINHVKVITLAILQYEAAHGHLPPPYTTDDDGNPLHSWRVLILPYLGEDGLYHSIDLEKPWHHPDNLRLQTRMPDVYRCPASHNKVTNPGFTTAYVAILGDDTAWPISQVRLLSQIRDGPDKTLAVLESENNRTHWMSTADPTMGEIDPYSAVGNPLIAQSSHQGEVVYSRCDGSVGTLTSDTDLRHLRALVTIDGGDQLDFPHRCRGIPEIGLNDADASR